MNYWIWLVQGRDSEPLVFEESVLPLVLPDRIADMMVDQFVDRELGLCRECPMDEHGHPIERGTGRKFCTVLLHDAIKPRWRMRDVL